MISFIGYSYFPKHRKHFVRRSGGLGVFVKDDVLPFVELIETDSEFLLLIKISKTLISKDEDMLISFVYLPPEGSDYSTNDSLSEIELTLLPYLETCKYFYMMGDLNARTAPHWNMRNLAWIMSLPSSMV